jgi:hypothetical protein
VTPENEEINMSIPTGAQAVPLEVSYWNHNGGKDEWYWHHFIHLIVEGLKRNKVKLLNYSQVTVVQQGPKENPLTFLQHLLILSESIPQWTQSHRWERFSSKINF